MKRSVVLSLGAAFLLSAAVLCRGAEKYTGPRPPKPDLPYLVHADTLVETEATEAKEEQRKDEAITYWISGTESRVKTPLAGPILLIQAEKLQPERMQLYKMEVKNGRREVFFSKKKRDQSSRPIRLSLNKVDENLYRIEVVESLPAGEFGLTPDGSNKVFAFQVY